MKRLATALAAFPAALVPALLAGCSGVFESSLAAPQTYVLRLPARAEVVAGGLPASASAGSVLVRRPEAGPGLDSNRIALLRDDRRFDFYAASLWAAPAPDVMESVVIDALRGTGTFAAVFDDAQNATWLQCSEDRLQGLALPAKHHPVMQISKRQHHIDRVRGSDFTLGGSQSRNGHLVVKIRTSGQLRLE